MDGPGPIPLSEFMAFCALVGIDDVAERMDLLAMIRRLDAAYLDYLERSRPRK